MTWHGLAIKTVVFIWKHSVILGSNISKKSLHVFFVFFSKFLLRANFKRLHDQLTECFYMEATLFKSMLLRVRHSHSIGELFSRGCWLIQVEKMFKPFMISFYAQFANFLMLFGYPHEKTSRTLKTQSMKLFSRHTIEYMDCLFTLTTLR